MLSSYTQLASPTLVYPCKGNGSDTDWGTATIIKRQDGNDSGTTANYSLSLPSHPLPPHLSSLIWLAMMMIMHDDDVDDSS